MIDKHLYTLLSGNTTITTACPRIYSEAPPSDVDLPFITYQELGSEWQYTWNGANDLLNSTVIVDVWGATKQVAIEIGEVILSELKNYKGAMGTKTIRQCEIENAISNFDAQTRQYVATIELNIWYS